MLYDISSWCEYSFGQNNAEYKREGGQEENPDEGDEGYFENEEEFDNEVTEAKADKMLDELGNLKN